MELRQTFPATVLERVLQTGSKIRDELVDRTENGLAL
jgi:hypothetical protein